MLSSQGKPKKEKSNSRSQKQLKKQDKNTQKSHSTSSKRKSKNTSNYSKQKAYEITPKNNKKESFQTSDYYNTQNYHKKPSNSSNALKTEDLLIDNKKHRRNNQDKNKDKEKNIPEPYSTKEINDYNQPVYLQQIDREPESKNKNPLFKKIKMLSSQGSIDFNGEIVRKNRLDSDTNKNNGMNLKKYPSYISPLHSQCKKHSKKKSEGHIKSGEKKGKLGSKSKKKLCREQNGRDTRRSGMNTSNTNFGFASPEKSKIYRQQAEKNQEKFSFAKQEKLHEICLEIQEDTENVYQYILSQELIKERGQCLNMLGKICSSMNLKRETFAIALCYIDSFLDINTQIKTVKTIAIASLMMGLKIDHAQTIGSGAQMETLSSIQSFTINKGLSMSTEARSQQKRGSGKKDSKIFQQQPSSSKQPKFNLNRPKLPNVLTTVLSHEQIFSEYDRILCKQEIMDMQMQMMVKLNFKLSLKSYAYWIQTLSSIWDNFIIENRPKLKSKVTFKFQQTFKNLSYLFQLVEISYFFPYAYFYPKSILVLSIMYILIRIRIQFSIEKEDKGFEHYKTNLGKSTNIIFIDKMGTNELFGDFLGLFQLDMGDIVNCCQYVSHYLSHKILRVSPFDHNRSMSYQQHVLLYHYNPQIFRFFQLKYSNCIDRGEA